MCEGAADKIETGARCSSESCLLTGIESQLFADSGGFQAESSGICRVCMREAQPTLPYTGSLQLADGGGRRVLSWKKDAVRMASMCWTTLSGGSLSSQNLVDEVGRHIPPGTCIKKSCSVKRTAALNSPSICLIYRNKAEETAQLWICCRLTACALLVKYIRYFWAYLQTPPRLDNKLLGQSQHKLQHKLYPQPKPTFHPKIMIQPQKISPLQPVFNATDSGGRQNFPAPQVSSPQSLTEGLVGYSSTSCTHCSLGNT